VTAVVELAAGLALVLVPSVTVSILLGASLDLPPALVVARLAGVALFSLGAACWLARTDAQRHPATALVAAMWLYNVAVAVLLISADMMGLRGWGLWPAVLGHLVLAAWCVVCLRASGYAVGPDLIGRR